MTSTVIPSLWFNDNVDEAVEFYGAVFKDFKLFSHNRGFNAEFELGGTRFMANNFGPHYKFNEAISLFVWCEDQTEVDFYWNALTANGGEPGRCGWLKDKFGVSWQVIPRALGKALSNPDREAAAFAHQAMMGMSKIIVDDLTAKR
jgi:predicted 3-demethylubiquinone-9 3-methyltransferase (glyoxalase superfamily)